jgi:hypothetical protein
MLTSVQRSSIGKRPSASVRRTCNVLGPAGLGASVATAPGRNCQVTQLVILADRDDMVRYAPRTRKSCLTATPNGC